MQRCFIAIDPPQPVKERLGLLRADIPAARWVPVDQIHLTLSFLGSIEESLLPGLCRQLGRIRAPGFQLNFSRTGCFPDHRHPRVLWLGLQPEPHLELLAGQIHSVLVSCGIILEDRPFSPHITLARIRSGRPHEADPFLDIASDDVIPSVTVREFILFQSRLTSQGAIHAPIMRFPLDPV